MSDVYNYVTCLSIRPAAATTCWCRHVGPCWYFAIRLEVEIRLARPQGNVLLDGRTSRLRLHYYVGGPSGCCPVAITQYPPPAVRSGDCQRDRQTALAGLNDVYFSSPSIKPLNDNLCHFLNEMPSSSDSQTGGYIQRCSMLMRMRGMWLKCTAWR